MSDMRYTIRRAPSPPPLDGEWDAPPWPLAETAAIDRFHPRSSDHRPRTQVRVLYDERGLYVHFHVDDRYVRCVNSEHQGPVCRDSCVEFFVEPVAGKGYFNFETNCGGAIHLSYMEDPTRTDEGFAKRTMVPLEWVKRIEIATTMPATVESEIETPIEWRNAYFVPFELFEQFVGPLGEKSGRRWRGNFYKCGDRTSHPHWATWAPIGDELNFHAPEHFAPIVIE